MSSSFLSSHPDFTSPPPLGPLTLHPSLNNSYSNNPIEQFHFRTVQRIVKEHPEFIEAYQLPVPHYEPARALKYSLRTTPTYRPIKMSAKQTMTWNGEADAKLLLAILKVSDVKPDFEAVAAQLTTETTTCTPRAVQEHLKKLRKLAQSDAADSTTTTPSGKSTTATPGKKAASRKAAGTPANGVKKTRKPTGGKGKKGKSAAIVHDDDEDETVKTETGGDVLDEGGLIGSELADLAQAEIDDEMSV